MKKNKLFLFVVFLAGVLLASCYDDKTTYDVDKLPEVMIDTTGIGKDLTVIQFERLQVTPSITKSGKKSEDLTYLWCVSTEPLYHSSYTELSDQMNLDEIIKLVPSSSPYLLWLTVTDQKTGVQYLMSWRLYVYSGLGEGLVVADTRDGITSDLHLIVGKQFTDKYSGADVVKRNLYSLANNSRIDGVVNMMCYNVMAKVKNLYAAGDKTFMTVSPIDYTLLAKNEDMFFEAPGTINIRTMSQANVAQAIVQDNKAWLLSASMGDVKFGTPIRGNYFVDYDVAYSHNPGSGSLEAAFYDSRNSKFWKISTVWNAASATISSFSADAFDPNAVAGMECKKSEFAYEGNAYFLLRDKATGAYSIYVFDGQVAAPKTVYRLPANNTLDRAVSYVFCQNQNVMYYATSTEIYAVILAGSVATIESRYSLDPLTRLGEQITGLSMYRQAWYLLDEGTDDADGWPLVPIATNNLQLLMTTYNEGSGEGKVNTLPILNLGIGTLDKANLKEYKGFNRITCVAPQDK